MAARVKKKPPFEPFVVEAIAKVVLGVISVMVLSATFLGISILYDPTSNILKLTSNFGTTGAALILGLTSLSIGMITAAILLSVKRL